MTRIAALLLCALTGPLAGQTPHSSLTQVIGHLLRTQLRGGGWRDTLVWQPYDSVSSVLLHRIKLGPYDSRVPAGSQTMHCPGSTDSSWTAYSQPVGYVVHAQVRFRTPYSATVDLGLACQFVFNGQRRGFGQGKHWEVVRVRNRWQVKRLMSGYIT